MQINFWFQIVLFSSLTWAKAPPFIDAYCEAFSNGIKDTVAREKADSHCKLHSRDCDSRANWAAKALCVCTPDKYPEASDQERCYEVAATLIQKNEGLKTSAVLAGKTPVCVKIKKSAADGDVEAHKAHSACLKDALFETDLVVQGQHNEEGWRQHREDQKAEKNIEIQEKQRLNESIEDFNH